MKKVSSHYIYCGKGELIKYGIITLDNGVVTSITPSAERLTEAAQTEFYSGVIIPAIVNVTSTELWYPQDDQAIESMIKGGIRPPYAIITPHSIGNLSSSSLEMLVEQGVKLALGSPIDTHPATLFRLMVRVAERLPSLPFTEVATIATSNGAAAMESSEAGSIAIGLKPSLYHIAGFDFQRMTIDTSSKLTVLKV